MSPALRPRVELELPVVLEPVVGRSRMSVRGRSFAEALEYAFEKIPPLRHHLMRESGELRPHILCLVNGTNVPREKLDSWPLADGDELLIHQAVSGG